jgi:arsenate reductase-like glutaredoxin family protein
MLLKRPIIATNDTVLVGFQPEIWEKELTKEES